LPWVKAALPLAECRQSPQCWGNGLLMKACRISIGDSGTGKGLREAITSVPTGTKPTGVESLPAP
jgi:hypothetical protein